MLYERLDRLRERASGYLAETLSSGVATPDQGMSERDSAAAEWSRRLGQLNAAENGLCFGRLDLDGGERRYVGRMGIVDDDGDYEPLLMDWRAPAARPFYVATAARPEGVRRRRHIRTRLRQVTRVDDEVLDLADPGGGPGTPARPARPRCWPRSAPPAPAGWPTSSRPSRPSRTRSSGPAHGGVLVVQGGAGTGKTAVALHRAAYLLYTHREQLRAARRAGRRARTRRSCATSARCCRRWARPPSCWHRRRPVPRASPRTGRSRRRSPRSRAGRRWPPCWPTAVRDRQRVPGRSTGALVDGETACGSRPRRSGAPATAARRTRRPHNQARPVFAGAVRRRGGGRVRRRPRRAVRRRAVAGRSRRRARPRPAHRAARRPRGGASTRWTSCGRR